MICIFHSDEYLGFLSRIKCFDPFRFVISRDKYEIGQIQGYIQKDGGWLKSFFTRRAIINGGPVLSKDISEIEVEALLKTCIKGLRGKAIYVETRNFNDYSEWRPVFEKCGFYYEPHYDFIVDTSSLEVAESNLGKSRRRDVRTSIRDGAVVIDNPDEKRIIEFYNILSDLYRKRVKTPLFPLDFFIKLSQESFCKFLLIEYQKEIIGGTVCVFDDETVYEWFVCGKDGVYKSVFPSTLATWSGIKFAAESGRSRFDMMGAGTPGDGGYGVREFKSKFGGKLVEYGRYKYIINKPLYGIGKFGVGLMKKI